MSAPIDDQDVVRGADRAGGDLFRLVYRSRCALAGEADDVRRAIEAIVSTARRRNAGAGVTGALMFTGLYFVQALEGPAGAVEATFDRICCDLRHTAVEVLECGPVLETVFGGWSMSHLVPEGGADALIDRVEAVHELADAAAVAMRLMASLIRSQASARAPAAPGATEAAHRAPVLPRAP